MDEVAITPEPIRKSARIGNKCDRKSVETISFPTSGIARLPVEIIFEILSYLSNEDLYAVGHVSKLFKILAHDPFLWRTYEVTNDGQDTSEVIKELKRMPLLKKFSISARSDCDDILRHVSLSNKSLEELHVSNCTDMPDSPCVDEKRKNDERERDTTRKWNNKDGLGGFWLRVKQEKEPHHSAFAMFPLMVHRAFSSFCTPIRFHLEIVSMLGPPDPGTGEVP
ncbi:uncharacterized protein LOC117602929 isoform X3 [Osmia lignaria lignaria]|uniref:uncharacterized protein LOC117602929 isoform X3 n=1 Tax=Osmia lignaria lignaria TaxID=1437193 RepID=UPI0014795DAB|nr:uncharacterized protein LOC117602929 isoform X3 [Osmia lignaria]